MITELGYFAKGSVEVILLDKFNKIKQKIETHNRIVTTGCNLLASLLSDGKINKPSHLAIGTGTTSPTSADVSLGNEVARLKFDKGYPKRGYVDTKGHNINGNVVVFQTTFGPANPAVSATVNGNTSAINIGITQPITEAGIFNAEASSTGDSSAEIETNVMFNRATFAPVNKSNEDTLIIRWTVVILGQPDVSGNLINNNTNTMTSGNFTEDIQNNSRG